MAGYDERPPRDNPNARVGFAICSTELGEAAVSVIDTVLGVVRKIPFVGGILKFIFPRGAKRFRSHYDGGPAEPQ